MKGFNVIKQLQSRFYLMFVLEKEEGLEELPPNLSLWETAQQREPCRLPSHMPVSLREYSCVPFNRASDRVAKTVVGRHVTNSLLLLSVGEI